MKRIISLLISIFLIATLGFSAWRYNPFTGTFDYYESGSGGAFTDLTDTPSAYTGESLKVLRVNVGETAIEFATVTTTDEKVGIDSLATAGYLGAAYNDGVLRVDLNELTYTDGGDFITIGLADHDTARTALGLAIGNDVQAYDADLTTYAGITPSANVQTLLGAADYAAFKTSLSLNNVENTALSSWVGTSNITTVGTISSGTGTAPAYSADPTVDTVTVNEVVKFDAEYNIGFQASNFTWDLANGQYQKVTLGGTNQQITISNASYVGSFSLRIIQDATGSRTIDWDNCSPEPKWFGGGTNPTMSTAANAVDVLSIRCDGSGNCIGEYSADAQ